MLDILHYDIFINVDRDPLRIQGFNIAHLCVVTRQVVYDYTKELPVGFMSYVDLPPDPNSAHKLGISCIAKHLQTRFAIDQDSEHLLKQYPPDFDSLKSFEAGVRSQADQLIYPNVEVVHLDSSPLRIY